MGITHVDAGKEKCVEICEELLKRYREEGGQFLLNIVTEDDHGFIILTLNKND